MFIPSTWAREVKETKASPQLQSIAYYHARYILGLPIPEWMIP